MQFDKWFNSQSTLLKVILLILPLVGWVVEVLVVFVLFLLVGWGWFLGVIDLIYLVLKGHLILAD